MGRCPYCKKHIIYSTLHTHPTDPGGVECPHCGQSIGYDEGLWFFIAFFVGLALFNGICLAIALGR